LKRKHEVFQNFSEFPLQFAPTHTIGNKKQNLKWGNRIFVSSLPNCNIKQEQFSCFYQKNRPFIGTLLPHPFTFATFSVEILSPSIYTATHRIQILFPKINISTGKYIEGNSSEINYSKTKPYIAFYLPAIDQTKCPCSSVKQQETSISLWSWTRNEIPVLKTSVPNIHFIKFISFGVFGFNNSEKDIFLGSGVLSLMEGCEVNPTSFSIQLMKDGKLQPFEMNGLFHIHFLERMENSGKEKKQIATVCTTQLM